MDFARRASIDGGGRDGRVGLTALQQAGGSPAAAKMAEGDASVGNADLGEIDLTWMDKLRKMVSSDAEWEAIILKKMEEKRNREMGIEMQEEQPSVLASVGGLFNKMKSYIPTRKGGADFSSSQGATNADNAPAVDGSRDVMESQ